MVKLYTKESKSMQANLSQAGLFSPDFPKGMSTSIFSIIPDR